MTNNDVLQIDKTHNLKRKYHKIKDITFIAKVERDVPINNVHQKEMKYWNMQWSWVPRYPKCITLLILIFYQ